MMTATVTGYRTPQACKAAQASYRQMDYWARTGLVIPSIRPATGSGTRRLYSTRDVLKAAIVKRLASAGLQFQAIRRALTLIDWDDPGRHVALVMGGLPIVADDTASLLAVIASGDPVVVLSPAAVASSVYECLSRFE